MTRTKCTKPGSLALATVLALWLGGMAAAQETAPPATAPPVTAQETDPAAPPTVEPATPPANVDAAPPAAGAEAPATPPDAMPVDPAEPRPAGAGEEALSPILPHDLSPWGMFMAADIVVKAVMIGLAFASLITWTVWLAKSLELFAARMKLQRAVTTIVRARTLDDASKALADAGGTGSLFVEAARQEVSLSEPALEHVDGSGLKERVASRLTRIEAQASRRMTRGTGLLATIGSTAPFVGLFGTVWGIMNAFIGISESQTTNLAVVAPGIAEALLATALGLVAAIPAVVIYNVFARAIAGYRQVLADAAAGVERLVSRDLDYRTVPRSAAQRGA